MMAKKSAGRARSKARVPPRPTAAPALGAGLLARQADQRLLDITRQVLSDLSIDQIIETSLLALQEYLQADTCAWYWVDAAAGLLLPAANLEGSRWLTAQLQSWPIPVGSGLMGLAASSGQALLANDAPHDPRSLYPPGYVPRSIHMLSLPLLVQDKAIAVVGVGRVTDRPYTRDDFEFAQLVVSQTALAVSKARLLERIQQMNADLEQRISARTAELASANQALQQEVSERQRVEAEVRRRTAYLAALHEITLELLNHREVATLLQTIVERAAELLEAPYGELTLAEGGGLVMRAFTRNQPFQLGDRVERADSLLTWRAFDTRQPVMMEDYSAWPQRRAIYAALKLTAVASIPIITDGRCVGVLDLARDVAGYPFDDEQIQIATLLAQLAALVLDSVQLYAGAEHEIGERQRAEAELRVANERLQQQLTEIEALQALLREQANRDPLTGLYNRRYLHDTLEREVSRAAREGSALSIVIMDIDEFKTINDRFGHAAGDQMIQSLGHLLQTQTRSGDVACRYGGEEFLVVLPGASLAAAQARAEHWRAVFQSQRLAWPGGELRATLSLGIAAFPSQGRDGDEVVRRADQALYVAKAQGRNQVVVWELNA